jgi:hypothetical protein
LLIDNEELAPLETAVRFDELVLLLLVVVEVPPGFSAAEPRAPFPSSEGSWRC